MGSLINAVFMFCETEIDCSILNFQYVFIHADFVIFLRWLFGRYEFTSHADLPNVD